jgi:hypothetical protein
MAPPRCPPAPSATTAQRPAIEIGIADRIVLMRARALLGERRTS